MGDHRGGTRLGLLAGLAAGCCVACGGADAGRGGGGSGGQGGEPAEVVVGGAGGAAGEGAAGGEGGAPAFDDGPLICDGPGALFATHVLAVDYGPGQDHGRDFMPDIALGAPLGGGCCQGSLDVVSLGNGGSIVLAFAGNGIADGPGVDFVVFENPFEVAGGAIYAELAEVAVSEDGETWHSFPCDATEPPWGACAGHHPVYLEGGEGPVDPEADGGDGYDLADLGLSQARYLRITDREDLTGDRGVFDLDAVGIVHPVCP
ncbi:MAG: hypothetical protein R3B72_31295 [Polyangiaceae bacterium]